MSTQIVQSVSDVNAFVNIGSIGSGASVRVFDGSTSRLVTDTIQYVCITNTHATNTLYVGFSSSVASTLYWRELTPGQFVELNGNGRMDKLLGSIYVIASGASTTMTLTTLV